MYRKNDFVHQLAAMGIAPGDTLMVHSSYKSIGSVDGGPDTVLDALSEYLADGLLVFPTLSYAAIDAAHPLFKVVETPSCVGILSELFRQRPGVIRSWHPTHSVAAFGRDADVFTAGHEQCGNPVAIDSPWHKLLERQAKTLFVGTGTACNTMLHGLEDWMNVPNCLYDVPQQLQVETSDGRIIEVPTRRFQGRHWRFYGKPEELLVERGAAKVTRLGDAVCHLADAVQVAAIISRLLSIDPDLFTDDRPLPPL